MLLVIKCDKVCYLFCPQYEGLSLEKILQQTAQYPEVLQYFPVQKEIQKLPRQWVINVIYTIVGKSFADWVQQQIDSRNEKMASDHNLMIELDPDIAAAFRASTQISSKYANSLVDQPKSVTLLILSTASKGISANLLKLGTKRRRSKAEIAQYKEEQAFRAEADEARLARIHDLEK